VEPDLNRVSSPAGETVLEPKTMAVLVYLAQRRGQVVPAEELINEFWAGLSDEILNRLTRYPKLRVIARSSSFAFKDSDTELPNIAGLLGVEFLLQGSVRLEGDRLRVTATLIDREGFQVWSDTFENLTDENITVQDEIAKEVAKSLLRRTDGSPSRRPHSSFEAYQHYFIAREMMIRRPDGFLDASMRHLNQAIEVDPQFADAYAIRATAFLFNADSPSFDKALFLAAQRDIDQALSIDPNSAQAHAAQGFLFRYQKPDDPVTAEAAYRRALTLDPYLVNAWNWLAGNLKIQGRYDEAFDALQNAVRIDPLAPSIGVNLADWEAELGQFDAAEWR
jgi:TolB-like protein